MGESIRTAERIREVNERTSDAICVTVNDRIAFANSSTLRLFGMQTAEECLSHSLLGLFDPYIQPILKAGIRRLLEKRSESLLVDNSKIVRRDHTLVNVSLHAVRLEWDGAPAIKVSFR
jgi:hypothetical protein